MLFRVVLLLTVVITCYSTENKSIEDSLIKKTTYTKYHIVGFNASQLFIRIPYNGFFNNGELFNLNGQTIALHYCSNFYRSQKWFLGFLVGYDWYRLKFYNLTSSYEQFSNASNEWNKQKYTSAELLNEVINYNVSPVGLKDSMLKYYGEKYYYFEYFRIGYTLKYITSLNKRWAIQLTLESSGSIPREISRLEKGQGGYDGSIDWRGSDLFALTPFNVFVNFFERINNQNKQNGLVQYGIGFQYRYKINLLVIHLSWANLFFTYDIDNKPRYSQYTNQPGCLGCPPINTNGYTPGYFYVPVVINSYPKINFSIEYHIVFTKIKKYEEYNKNIDFTD